MLTLEKITKEKRVFLINILEKIKEQSEIITIIRNDYPSDNILYNDIQYFLKNNGYIVVKKEYTILSATEMLEQEDSKFKLYQGKVVFKDCVFITKKGEKLLEELKINNTI